MESRLPITVVSALGNICSNTYESRKFLLHILWFDMPLVGGVLTKGNYVHLILCINDVRFVDTKFNVVPKSDFYDQLCKVKSQDSNICLVKLMVSFLRVRPQISGR